MIFCLYGAFLENSLSKQNVPSSHMLAVCMQGRERVFPFFLRLAAPCMVLLRRFKILLGQWIGGKWNAHNTATACEQQLGPLFKTDISFAAFHPILKALQLSN